MGKSALAGIRIADLTIITAGANATQMLADFGADVIKVESAVYPDPFRSWTAGPAGATRGDHHWDASPTFNTVNRNKRGISLDLKHPLGRDAFLRLVAVSDIVVENFRRGVLDRLGLAYEQLVKVRPNLVMVSLSSQGTDGPESRYSSYGSTLEALSGFMGVTGYDADFPVWTGNDLNYPDQAAAIFGAGVILAALRQRRRTGKGVYVDLCQRELMTGLIGEIVLDYTVNGRVRGPSVNRYLSAVPSGCYRCLGDDAWVAITVGNNAHWAALCRAMGRPELACDPRYATAEGRRDRAAEIDAEISAWTKRLEKRQAMAFLQAAGVPAGAVLNGRDLLEDPHLASRGFLTPVEHPVVGIQVQRTFPMTLERTPGEIRMPAPCLGEHTREILTGLLGYSVAEVDALEQARVIGYVPLGSDSG